MKGILKRYTRVTDENPIWLVGLTDIMTNLMLFFIILYVFTIQGKATKGDFMKGFDPDSAKIEMKEDKGRKMIQKMKEKDAAELIAKKLAADGLGDVTEVVMTNKFIRINLSAPILFASGEDKLSRDARNILQPIAALLAGLEGNDIIVEGHTDSVPIKSGKWKTNWELSAARANAVVDFFGSDMKIANSRMISAAYGEYRPIGDNNTREGRARNRRIEIVILRKDPGS